MNHFNMHFNPWAAGFFSPTQRLGHASGPGFFRPPFGFGGGLAHGWMQHASQGMSNGWGCWGRRDAFDTHCGFGGRVPREGRWNAERGSYTMGRSGTLQVKVGQSDADFNDNMQYRVNNGPWQHLAHSKDAGDKSIIHAPPGSNVQFRIQTPDGHTFRAGTIRNVDGLDHARVNRTSNGYTLGFEDQRGAGDGDFNDAVLHLSDPGRRR